MLKPLMTSALILAAAPLHAGGMATGEEIRAALSDATATGGMNDGSTYTEYYAPDGTIRAETYTGHWGVVGNQACFVYSPESAGCWELHIHGKNVTWMRAGTTDGVGDLTEGNPNNF